MRNKFLAVLLSVVLAFGLMSGVVCADGIPGWLEPFWMADPLQPGAEWWRDTANQNAIAQYYYDIYTWVPHVENIADGIYVVRGVGKSNVVALIGETEWVLIDSTECPQYMQVALLLLRPYVETRKLNALIYTGEDHTHYSGSYVVAAPFSIPVWADDDFFNSLAKTSSVTGVVFPRNLKSYGVYLPEDPDWRIGPATIYGKFPFHYPSRLVYDEVELNLAGFNVKLIPAPSATDAGLLVWLSDYNVLACGDAWSPEFASIGPLTAQGRSVQTWSNTIQLMLSLNPDYLVPTHGPVISSNTEIQSILTNYDDAMNYVHDRTLALLNLGLPTEDVASEVQLPEPLASDPYLQQFISDIPAAVKVIASQYIGWFNGEAPELAGSLSTAKRAEIMVELAGGLAQTLEAAKNAEVAADDLETAEKALLMAWAAYKVAPDNVLAAKIYSQALKKNAYMQRSNQTRNYYLTTALMLDSALPEVIEASIDIKPGSDSNSINLGSNGVVPVALLATDEFDVNMVDPATVIFAGAEVEKWISEDVDGDGDFDILFHFDTEELNLTQDSTEATLSGQTVGGQEFTATDTVRIVPVKGKK